MPSGPVSHGALFRKSWTMGPPLSKGRTSGLIPPRFLDLWDPSEIRDNERIDKERGVSELDERHDHHGRMDEECLRYATLPKISWLLLWMQHGARLALLWLLPIFVLVVAFGWFQEPDDVTLHDFFWGGIFPFVVYVFFPMIFFWGLGYLLEKKYPHVVYREPKGPLWELNRRTGMVTLFKDPEKECQSGAILGQAPFHEWDGYLLSLPDHQGNIWYRLVLVHKTQEWALPLNQLLAATTNREDVLAYWDLIRQYMDVSKPLPDIPLFEPWRHLDSTTSECDEKAGRAVRYWRDMNDEDYECFKRQNQIALANHSWR